MRVGVAFLFDKYTSGPSMAWHARQNGVPRRGRLRGFVMLITNTRGSLICVVSRLGSP
ncbi:hypothetical protein CHELA1G11_21303 [Hyphomicrobiales bacterium]|nr:hypothetical protein CHELA1G11_21303 [Hyphomicrobiales bacterium]CAH1694132.1 hypothetical protein CHELA1G2_21609 [Hyphomicrobiales bacterium]